MADYTVQLGEQTVNVAVTVGGATTLDKLNDVDIDSPINGERLVYNSTTSKWENSSDTTDTDEKTKVSSNDTTAGYLNGKLVAGNNITLTENNNGGDETLTVAVDTLTASDISDFDTEVSNNSAVSLNTAKVTNTITNITVVESPTNVEIQSSDGTNDTIASANETNAGVMTTTMYDEHVANNAKVTNVSTNLSEGTSTETTVDVNSSDGTNATLAAASTSRAGLLTKAKFDEIVANNAKVTNATHSGDATGDTVLTLATVNSNVGSFTNADITVNAKGLITAASNGSGGVSSPSVFEATVGVSGADYTTLGAAITAGKTRILVIDDTTETGDITLPSNVIIQGLGKDLININMSGNIFDSTTNDNFTFKDLSLTMENTTGTSYSLFAVSGTNLYLENIHIDNTGTTRLNTRVVNSANGKLVMKNCSVDLPNNSGCGVYVNTSVSGEEAIIDGLRLQGGGTACVEGLAAYNNVNINNIYLFGTYKTNSNAININHANINNVTCDATNEPIQLEFDNGANATNIFSDELRACSIYINADASVSNITTLDAASHIFISGENASVSNVSTEGDIQIYSAGKFCRINNSNIAAGITVTPDDCTITGCKVGSDAGGGSNTITVNAGANRTIIGNSRTDAAIVDNGTGTVESGNAIY